MILGNQNQIAINKLFRKKQDKQMKLLKKTLVATGVATAVFVTGAAQAATVNQASVTAATGAANPTYDRNIANESVKTIIDLPTINIGMAATEALSVDDSVTFTLSSGVFKTNGTIASNLGGSLGLISGGVGFNNAVYRVTTAATVGALITLTGAEVTGTTIADNAKVTTTIDMSGFVGGSATALFGSPLITNSISLTPAVTATVTGTTGVFDVAAGFAALTTATGTTSATTGVSTTKTSATITATNGAGAVAGANKAGIPAAAPDFGKTLVTITGPMTGISEIGGTNISPTTAAGAALVPAGKVNTYSIDTANNAATGVQTALSGTTTISFAGGMAYDVSAYTATVSRLADGTNYAANPNIGSGTAFTFSRNGTSFTTNSFGSKNKLTVSDRSGALGGVGADGAIAVSAWDAAGEMVTCTGLTIAPLANRGTTTIQGADVTAACPGAKRIDGIVNSTSILVTNTKLTADGATSQAGLSTGASTSAN